MTTETEAKQDLYSKLSEQFAHRAETQGWKKGTKTFLKHKLESMCGAAAACELTGTPFPTVRLFILAVGRDE